MRTNYKRIQNILNNNYEDAEIVKSPAQGLVLCFHDEQDFRVRVVLCDHGIHQSECGIHLKLTATLERDLINAISVAERDLFPTIWVHQKPKPNEDRRLRLIKGIRGWIDSIRSKGFAYGSMSINKPFIEVYETLETMNEDQLEAMLCCMSACYQKSGQESRDFRASMKRAEEGA